MLISTITPVLPNATAAARRPWPLKKVMLSKKIMHKLLLPSPPPLFFLVAPNAVVGQTSGVKCGPKTAAIALGVMQLIVELLAMYLTFIVLVDAQETVTNLESLYSADSKGIESRYPCEKRVPGAMSLELYEECRFEGVGVVGRVAVHPARRVCVCVWAKGSGVSLASVLSQLSRMDAARQTVPPTPPLPAVRAAMRGRVFDRGRLARRRNHHGNAIYRRDPAPPRPRLPTGPRRAGPRGGPTQARQAEPLASKTRCRPRHEAQVT